MSDKIVVKPRNKIPVLFFKKINPLDTAPNIFSGAFSDTLTVKGASAIRTPEIR